jgi:hypothetical protein
VIEFHDPGDDSYNALLQARPGHESLGITDRGGYIQHNFVYTCLPRGVYESQSKLLKIVVYGRALEPRELLEACALRIEPGRVDPGPVRQVAYVFPEEAEADANLAQLAVRELECRIIRDGIEMMLDGSDRRPPRPSWTQSSNE